MLTFWQLLLAFALVISPAIVAAIQFVEASSFGDGDLGKACAKTLIEQRLSISFSLSIVAGFLALLSTAIFRPKRVQEQFRESIMDGIFEQVLDNDRNTARITLFKDVKYVRKWWYRLKDLASLLKHKTRLADAWEYTWNANYIRIASRWGNHHRNSKTYFYVNLEEASKCQAIAGQVRQMEIEIVKELPRCDHLNLKAVNETNATVKEILENGYIRDMKVLRSIKKVAPYFYAHIVFAQGGKKKLVLVIDSWAEANPFSPQAQQALAIYRKQLSASYGA
jgi:hypothetical protein